MAVRDKAKTAFVEKYTHLVIFRKRLVYKMFWLGSENQSTR